MCGRYRLTKRRMLEIEQYYDIDELADLEIWKREYNIPPREMAPAILEAHGKRRLTAGLWVMAILIRFFGKSFEAFFVHELAKRWVADYAVFRPRCSDTIASGCGRKLPIFGADASWLPR
jgi:hypothetical protein